MKIRALVNFSGLISMYEGEEIDCDNKEVVTDLLNAKYVEEIKSSNKEEKKSESKRNKS